MGQTLQVTLELGLTVQLVALGEKRPSEVSRAHSCCVQGREGRVGLGEWSGGSWLHPNGWVSCSKGEHIYILLSNFKKDLSRCDKKLFVVNLGRVIMSDYCTTLWVFLNF